MSNQAEFEGVVAEEVELFLNNDICRKVDDGKITLSDYGSILRMIFHQTYEAPQSFALGATENNTREISGIWLKRWKIRTINGLELRLEKHHGAYPSRSLHTIRNLPHDKSS